MNIPEFTAEASVGSTLGIYKGTFVLGRSPSVSANVIVARSSRVWAAMQSSSFGTRSLANGSLGFACGPNSCACAGVDDCLDLIVTTDLCGPSINCVDFLGATFCACTRK
jgi:hypothetical protein